MFGTSTYKPRQLIVTGNTILEKNMTLALV